MKAFSILLPIFLIACANTHAGSQRLPQGEHATHKKVLGKSRGLLEIQVLEKEKTDDKLVLVAKVSPNKEMKSAQFQWKLPEHVKVKSGNLQQPARLAAGVVQSIEIELTRSSLKPGDQIFFFAYQLVDGERLGGSAQYLYEELTAKDAKLQRIQEHLKGKKIVH